MSLLPRFANSGMVKSYQFQQSEATYWVESQGLEMSLTNPSRQTLVKSQYSISLGAEFRPEMPESVGCSPQDPTCGRQAGQTLEPHISLY